MGVFLPSTPHPPVVSAPGKGSSSHASCFPPPSPQAWLCSGAGWRESFSLNQYKLPSGSREQICSHLKAAFEFPYYEGVSGALSESRKDQVPKAKQTPSCGEPGRAGQEPRRRWGRGGRRSGPGSGQAGGRTDPRAARVKPARGLRTGSSCVYW